MTNPTLSNLQDKLCGAHSFRRRVAASHPDDPRNEIAAELLLRLATADHATVEPDTLATLQSLHKSPGFKDAVNDSARQTGFRHHPHTLNDFANIVIAKLNPLN
jgi:hypothetical protein